MLESDANDKVCPVMSGAVGLNVSFVGGATQHIVRCQGSACMGWDEWMEWVGPDGRAVKEPVPYDPPQGDCGMKPPEPQCGYPG